MGSKVTKLTKTKWREFFKITFGTNNVEFDDNRAMARIGTMGYNAWISDDRIYVQININNYVFQSFYFNIDTFEFDYSYNDEQERLYKQELYDEWKSNLD